MLEVVKVDHTNYLSFNRFLLPAYLKQLQSADSTLWGIGMVHDTVSVGILLAKLDFHSKTANIVHFLIKTETNNIYITERLLNSAESMLADNGFTIIDATVTIDKEIEAVCNLFFKKGWCSNSQIVNKYIIDMKKMQNNEWVWQLEKPAHLNVVHWSTTIEKEFKQSLLNKEIGDSSMNPYLTDLKSIDFNYSFALYTSGEIAGWCLCERVAQNMLLTINSYVKQSAATRLGGMMLYAELVKKALEDDMYIIFFVHVNNKSMQNIVNRRFKESIIQKTTNIQFIK